MSSIYSPVKESLIAVTRIFDAPRELVWKAWTEPNQVMRWWGPKYFTSPSCTIDLRVGGRYLFCMKSLDGTKYWSTGVYHEIVPMERLVYTDSFADEKGNVVHATHYGMSEDFPFEMMVTITFEDEGDGKTKMTLTQVGVPEGEASKMTRVGWESSFDKLAKSLLPTT